MENILQDLVKIHETYECDKLKKKNCLAQSLKETNIKGLTINK